MVIEGGIRLRLRVSLRYERRHRQSLELVKTFIQHRPSSYEHVSIRGPLIPRRAGF
jgi:hypothetical protein